MSDDQPRYTTENVLRMLRDGAVIEEQSLWDQNDEGDFTVLFDMSYTVNGEDVSEADRGDLITAWLSLDGTVAEEQCIEDLGYSTTKRLVLK
jgi:hypothetical protein